VLFTHYIPNVTIQSEVLDTAMKGTLNIMKVSSAAKVQKLVVLSSVAAVDFITQIGLKINSKMRVAGRTKSSARRLGLVMLYNDVCSVYCLLVVISF
jgi:nucleoside-diphosphate-sugar epimerase